MVNDKTAMPADCLPLSEPWQATNVARTSDRLLPTNRFYNRFYLRFSNKLLYQFMFFIVNKNARGKCVLNVL